MKGRRVWEKEACVGERRWRRVKEGEKERINRGEESEENGEA